MEINPSDAAIERVAKDFNWLPEDAAKLLAGWLTLLAECDAGWRAKWYPDPETSTSMIMARSLACAHPRDQAEEMRVWQLDREVLMRPIMDLLNAYPRPVFVARAPERFLKEMFPIGMS